MKVCTSYSMEWREAAGPLLKLKKSIRRRQANRQALSFSVMKRDSEEATKIKYTNLTPSKDKYSL